MEKIGGSISYQLIDIFEIIEDDTLDEQQKREKIIEYQKSLTQEGKGILIEKERINGQNKKDGYFVFGNIDEMTYYDLVKTKEYVDKFLSSLTCEAEKKMSAIVQGYDKESHSIKYNFKLADKVYNYAQGKEKAVRGHTLVWHKHFPPAIDQYIEDRLGMPMREYQVQHPEDFEEKRKEYTKQFLGEYMKTVGEHYPQCYCWDVLNEIVPQMEIRTTILTAYSRRKSRWSKTLKMV